MIDPEVIARLEDTCMPPLLIVEGALDLAALLDAPQVKTPAAFVLPVSERADPNSLANSHSQRVFCRVGVALALKLPNTTTGRGGAAALQQMRNTVVTALLGWPPSPDHAGLSFVQGALVDLKKGMVWWMDVYQTDWYLRT